jgi:putative endonuclease
LQENTRKKRKYQNRTCFPNQKCLNPWGDGNKMQDNPKSKKALGDWGEKKAVEYLQKHGYTIIESNFNCRYGEIDIIAKEGPVWCFVEVRTRKSNSFGRGFESITAVKRTHITKTAIFFLNQRRLDDAPARFDVVSIDFYSKTDFRIELIKNAFYN